MWCDVDVQRVLDGLLLQCPRAAKWDGPYSREILREIDPALQDPIYADWICFGFEGYRPDQAHIGVMFDVKHFPVTYNVGIHAHDFVLAQDDETVSISQSELALFPIRIDESGQSGQSGLI